MTKTCKDYIGISFKTLYISIHFGTTLYQKKYMHAPRSVHACTFFNVNVDADVNNLRRVSIAEQVNVIVSVNVDFSRSLVIVIVNVIVFLANQVRQETTVLQSPQISASPDSV